MSGCLDVSGCLSVSDREWLSECEWLSDCDSWWVVFNGCLTVQCEWLSVDV